MFDDDPKLSLSNANFIYICKEIGLTYAILDMLRKEGVFEVSPKVEMKKEG